MLKGSNQGRTPREDSRNYRRTCRLMRNHSMKAYSGTSSLLPSNNAKSGMNEKSGLKTVNKKVRTESSTQKSSIDGSGGVATGGAKKDPITGTISHTISGSTFTLDVRYQDLKAIGKGSYGVVCCVNDILTNKKVAIKKIQDMSKHAADAKHVLREIRLMRYLGGHPNIVTLQNIYLQQDTDELYLVMDLMDSDLHKIIQSPQPLSDAHFRYFMFQLLKGVRFLHENRIIRRDLKPGNLLVTKSCQLKITDFGLARARPMGRGSHPDDTVDDPMTEHVVTRWYRPPELMLCPNGLYEYSVDLWSCGCILAEMLGRAPLFPGRNFVDQLSLIFDVVGSPAAYEVAHIRNPSAVKFLESMRGKQRKHFLHLFENASRLSVDLLEGLLVFDPPDRLTVHESISHPYFEPLWASDVFHDPYVSRLDFEFETQRLTVEGLRCLIVSEVNSFHEEASKIEELLVASAASENEMKTKTTSATSTTAVGATAKSGQQMNGMTRRTENNNTHDSLGGNGKTVQNISSSHFVSSQEAIQPRSSSVSDQKSGDVKSKSISPPRYPRVSDSHVEDRASSAAWYGTLPPENSSSLSSTSRSHRSTSRGHTAASDGGVSTLDVSNNGKNVHELSDRMHRLHVKHEKQQQKSGDTHHKLMAVANEAAGTIHWPRKGNNNNSDLVNGRCGGDETMRRSPTCTVHNEFNRVIEGGTSPVLECSKEIGKGTHAPSMDHIHNLCTSVVKPPAKQRRT